MLKFSIKNIGSELNTDQFSELILNPKSLNEIEHNISKKF